MWRIERIKECETGNNLSYPSCTVCSRTTKNIEKSAPFPLQKWKLIKGQRFGNGQPPSPLPPVRAAFNQPYPKYGWISFSLIDFKSSVCRFRRIMCVFISLHSYCRAGLWSKFNVFLFFLVDYFTVYICMCRFLSPWIMFSRFVLIYWMRVVQSNISLGKYMYIYAMCIYI